MHCTPTHFTYDTHTCVLMLTSSRESAAGSIRQAHGLAPTALPALNPLNPMWVSDLCTYACRSRVSC